MDTFMISLMKNVKDRMDNPMPIEQIRQIISVVKQAGANHLEVATVLGHPHFAAQSILWADEIHAQGLGVTWRCAHQNMEGLYGAPKFVGGNRKPEQFWIDEAVTAFSAIKDHIHAGDEEAIYPERTEGVFDDNTSWIALTSPNVYADFFINLHNALKVFPWKVGLSANNASEELNGWMPQSLANYAGVVVVDHYVDGDAAKWEADIRAIHAKYGKPVYVQEGAPSRVHVPDADKAKVYNDYFDAVVRLKNEGILYGFGSWSGWSGTPESILNDNNFGSWSGWSGTPESILNDNNGVFSLNAQGLILQAHLGSATPTPTPIPNPIPNPMTLHEQLGLLIADLTKIQAEVKTLEEQPHTDVAKIKEHIAAITTLL